MCYIFASIEIKNFIPMLDMDIKRYYAYLIPAIISAFYFTIAVFYYSYKIDKSLDGLML